MRCCGRVEPVVRAGRGDQRHRLRLACLADAALVGRMARSLSVDAERPRQARPSRAPAAPAAAPSLHRRGISRWRARGHRQRHEPHPGAELGPLEREDLRGWPPRARRQHRARRASCCARALSPPASSPTKMLTLRVNSTSPSGSSSPLVSASAPSTRSAPKACHQDLVLERSVLDRQRHPEASAWRSAWRAPRRCPGSWWRRSASPRRSAARGRAACITGVLNSASPRMRDAVGLQVRSARRRARALPPSGRRAPGGRRRSSPWRRRPGSRTQTQPCVHAGTAAWAAPAFKAPRRCPA